MLWESRGEKGGRPIEPEVGQAPFVHVINLKHSHNSLTITGLLFTRSSHSVAILDAQMRTRPHGVGDCEKQTLPDRPQKINKGGTKTNNDRYKKQNRQAYLEGTRAGRGGGRAAGGHPGASAADHGTGITVPRRATHERNTAV